MIKDKLKKVCKKCGYFTRDKKHRKYKCYCGDCPAKLRDERDDLKNRTFIYRFEVKTDCPFLTEEHVKHDLLNGSEGYKYEVEELPVL